ncbi:hypothetical protein [Fischerella thermalis]|nr:hypothetical protein [Fischerella thermalis]
MGATSFCVLTLGGSLIIGGTNLHLIGVWRSLYKLTTTFEPIKPMPWAK